MFSYTLDELFKSSFLSPLYMLQILPLLHKVLYPNVHLYTDNFKGKGGGETQRELPFLAAMNSH